MNPGFQIERAFSPDIDARHYFDATAKFGSPAMPVEEVRTAPESIRQAFDLALAQALGVALSPGSGTPASTPLTVDGLTQGTVSGAGSCRRLAPDAPNATLDVGLGTGTYSLQADGDTPVPLHLRRLATDFGATPALTLAPGAPSTLTIPQDALRDPWHLRLIASRPVRVCATG